MEQEEESSEQIGSGIVIKLSVTQRVKKRFYYKKTRPSEWLVVFFSQEVLYLFLLRLVFCDRYQPAASFLVGVPVSMLPYFRDNLFKIGTTYLRPAYICMGVSQKGA